MRITILVGVTLGLIAVSALAGLTTCRDCGRQVSDEALMCPGCGRSGDAIRRDLKQAPGTSQSSPGAVHPAGFARSIVRVATERAQGLGVVVACGTGIYAVTCQDLVAGARSLTLSYLDGEVVPYSGVELAADRNLARMPLTTSSNAAPMALATSTNIHWAVAEVSGSNVFTMIKAAESAGRFIHGMPLLDASTNLAALVVGTEPFESTPMNGVSEWVTVDPKAYRAQVEMLRAAFRGQKLRDGTPVTAETLRKVVWLTPFLQQRSKLAAARFEKSGGQP
jgi:hypothetical protein